MSTMSRSSRSSSKAKTGGFGAVVVEHLGHRDASARETGASLSLPRRSPPKGQHLLLVGRVAVRLNEIAGPARQPLSIVPRHVSHLGRDDLRDVSDPTFLHIERQDPNRSIVLPV